MTVRAILAAMRRRWYVPAAAVLIAAAFMAALVADGGTYTTRTVVSFTYPSKTSLSYGNGSNDASVIAFAGAVASEVNNGRPIARYSDDSAPYYGAGVREGYQVGLTASGNQWATSYPRADIEIQIVGRTQEWVQARQQELVGRVLATAESQQVGLSAASAEYITATVVPLTLDIEYVAASRVGVIMAGFALLLAALLVGGWGADVLDRSFRRRVRTDPMRAHGALLKESIS